MAQELERRSAETRVSVDGDHGRRLTGSPIVFNSRSVVMYDRSIGKFQELIRPEAVDRTLRMTTGVKALWNHNTDLVLGNTRAGTLRLRKTPRSLDIEIDPPSWAKPQIETVQRGDVDGMSFAFSVAEDGDSWEFDTADGIPLRTVHDMTFSEVSIVAFPAYPMTDVSVSTRSIEVFKAAHGRSIAFLRKVHKTNLAQTFRGGVNHYEG
jgi:HK97 family phage prohead protease